MRIRNEQQTATANTWSRIARYVFVRALSIALTIVIGVFVTVLIANRGGTIDASVERQVEHDIYSEDIMPLWREGTSVEERNQILAQIRWEKQKQAGLHLPYLPRHLLWTYSALRFEWGEAQDFSTMSGSTQQRTLVRKIILQRLPNTLLLVGSAYLILFFMSIGGSLFLYRKQGHWLDRVAAIMAPLSSIPGWVHGLLLILVFALELGWLPAGGMYDIFPPEMKWGYILIVARHMLLPIIAIVLSLVFQFTYSWRTFFLLFANEDYVELAKAKGLAPRVIDRRYILKPTFPYILTNFSLLLAGFWQMTTVLEYVFHWPGIGPLYIESLPRLTSASLYPGELAVTLGIVVIFAYLMGMIVFVLDFAYVLIDPRVQIQDQVQVNRKVGWRDIFKRDRTNRKGNRKPDIGLAEQRFKHQSRNFKVRTEDITRILASIKPVVMELSKYPSAVFGILMIAVLIGGSVVAVVAFPYRQLGESWYTEAMTGKPTQPKFGKPVWVNWFLQNDLPVTFSLNSQNGSADKDIQFSSNGETEEIVIVFAFDYGYTTFPQDMYLYFSPSYSQKRPFVELTWFTPDGRELEIGSLSTTPGMKYDFSIDVPPRQILAENPLWKNWFVSDGQYPTPGYQLLFANPDKDTPEIIPGKYQLQIRGLVFEPDADLNAELIVIGQVYGLAGTDHLRRDLLVPLLWGMPFALTYGLLGACVTTFLSMLLASISAWYGGWIDALIQRLIEANLILPVLAVGIILYAYYGISIWLLLAGVVLLNVFGSPTKSFRAALLQIKEAPYIEAAQAYGASNFRIIRHYLLPRILPILIPQLVTLIPSYVFLEATLGIFNIQSVYPTWGKIIYDALQHGYGSSRYWVLEPVFLLLLTGIAFSMLGFALERILNPKLKSS
jgi:peptide/nickel transport system permease protein